MSETLSCDIAIIGAGSAGCVLAARLSEESHRKVVLIEAGGSDWHPFIHIPGALSKVINKINVDWNLFTEPQAELNNRSLFWPRGKVLGGSSSINAMIYMRGQCEDYDDWVKMGATGWSYQDLLPYFKKSQHQERGPCAVHGSDGPLNVTDDSFHSPLSQLFIDAAMQAGLPHNADFVGESCYGVGYYQTTIKNRKRCSAAVAYLHPVKSRPNLTILTGALVKRLRIDNGRCTGLDIAIRARDIHVRAEDQVILSAGAIGSPQILLLSGIGPPQELRRHGLPVVHELPGVGQNLQDHLDICTLARVKNGVSGSYDGINEPLALLKYYVAKTGPLASNIAEAGGFDCSGSLVTRPDLQYHFVPAQLDEHGRHILPGRGMTIHACHLRPSSRGYIGLKSNDPAQNPLVQPRYLSEHGDLDVLIRGVERARDILAAPAFRNVLGEEVFPGSQATTRNDLIAFIRKKAETLYHPVGTCRIGAADDANAVVDPQLSVRGIAGLRIVDASVMPTVVSGNTNAPTIAIAERAADLIKNTGTS